MDPVSETLVFPKNEDVRHWIFSIVQVKDDWGMGPAYFEGRQFA